MFRRLAKWEERRPKFVTVMAAGFLSLFFLVGVDVFLGYQLVSRERERERHESNALLKQQESLLKSQEVKLSKVPECFFGTMALLTEGEAQMVNKVITEKFGEEWEILNFSFFSGCVVVDIFLPTEEIWASIIGKKEEKWEVQYSHCLRGCAAP